jgi:hypothetical protein
MDNFRISRTILIFGGQFQKFEKFGGEFENSWTIVVHGQSSMKVTRPKNSIFLAEYFLPMLSQVGVEHDNNFLGNLGMIQSEIFLINLLLITRVVR